MKLTIIIPVYRVEQTLERCVTSVLQQKFRDYQLLLVDDGSPDHCPQLCDQLAKQDQRIQVIHKKNGGLSDARNTALKKAKGEYVTFIDSDDYIGENTLQPLMDLLAVHHDWDILEYSAYEHYGWTGHMQTLRLENREYNDMRRYWYDSQAYRHTYAWNKIYRRELFRNVRFPEGKKFEDAYVLPQLLDGCQMVATTSLGHYYYCYNPQGITAQADGQAINDLLQAHLNVLSGGGPLCPPDNAYYAQVLNIALDVYNATGNVPLLPNPKALGTVHTPGTGTPLKVTLMKLLGLRTLCQLNRLLHRTTRR